MSRNQVIQRSQGWGGQGCTLSSGILDIRAVQACLFWNLAFEHFDPVSSGHPITHREHEKVMTAQRGDVAVVHRGSNNPNISLPFLVPQSLMDPPDAVKSTSYLILGGEWKPELKVPWGTAV